MPDRVIYIVRSWPRLSQTFIVNEVLALERRGLELVVFSLVRSGEDVVQPQVADVRAPVHYLDGTRDGADVRRLLSWCAIAPLRTFLVLVHCLLHPRMAAGYGEGSTRQCLGHALRVAAAVRDLRAAGDEPVRVHAHFAHDPALVGMLVSRLTGLPFSFTAHARDLYEIPVAEPDRPGAGGHRGGDLLRGQRPLPRDGRSSPGPSSDRRGPPRRRPAPVLPGRPGRGDTSAAGVGRTAGGEEGIPRPPPRAARGEAPRRALPRRGSPATDRCPPSSPVCATPSGSRPRSSCAGPRTATPSSRRSTVRRSSR